MKARPAWVWSAAVAAVLAGLGCESLSAFLAVPPASALPSTPTPTESVAAVSTARVPVESTEPPEATAVRRLELPNTPTPVPLMSADDPRSILDMGQPDYLDYFDVPGTWFDYDNPGVAAYRQEDGRLLGIDYEPEELYTWWSFTDPASGNVYAEVTATNGDCIARDSVGLVIRVDTEFAAEGYALDVSCDGAWRLRLHRRGQEPRELTTYAPVEVLATGPGASNRLGIYGYAGRFVLFLNGSLVGEVVDRDYTLSYGQFALYVRASQTFDLTATFDDFAFWHLPFLP